MLKNWIFTSIFSAIVGGFISYLLTKEWKVSVIASAIIFFLVLTNDPKRRYMKAFWVILSMLLVLNKFFFEIVGQISGIYVQLGANEVGNIVSVSLIFLAALAFILDYLERNGKFEGFRLAINKKKIPDQKDSLISANNSNIIQNIIGERDINITISESSKKENEIKEIQAEKDTNISILYYIKNNISIELEINNIKSGLNTDIRINKYFQNSLDYQKLVRRIVKQKEIVLSLGDGGGNKYLFEAKKLEELKKVEMEFKAGALRLADAFLKIEIRTERLIKAKDLFEKGLILEADKILVESDLINDQNSLIAQMDYLQKRKGQILKTIFELSEN